MGKIRTRIIGLEDVEKKQKEEQRRRSVEKKSTRKGEKHKIRAQGLKGGERMVQVEVGEESIEKMEKVKKLLESASAKAMADKAEKKKKVKVHVRGGNYKKAKKEIDQYSKKLEVGSWKLEGKNKPQTSNFKLLTLQEAIKLLKKVRYAKFDESVELHLKVEKEGLKGEIELPHSTGKSMRVKIVDDKVLAEIEKGEVNFDLLITHPQYMPRLARFAKVLGPKGLMPNPKAGTISDKPEEVAKKFSKGTLRWKTEAEAPLIHQMIGKISFEDKELIDNSSAFLSAVGKNHIQSAYLKTTMSPSVKIDVEKI
ncbi:hypothetical protein HY612_04160 [Candidatus Roizmanbacteria bacterium]|nr:hypothetical protein [Candidatus Roizmanbacteria bacterium]